MPRMTSRTIAGMSAHASVVTSPATCTCPVVMRVSTATRQVHVAGEKLFVDFAGRTAEVIDAGTGVGDLSLDALERIDHILLTHSHLDHVLGVPLLADSVLRRRQARASWPRSGCAR